MALQRLSGNDLTVLATDVGQVPMNIGAVLEFDPVDDHRRWSTLWQCV